MTLIRSADLITTPWKNGAGRKADIASGPGWTIGYAWLDQDAPFSDYAGHNRTITLIEGPGFTLESPDGKIIVSVKDQNTPTPFDGGLKLFCRIDGACKVLNVMTAAGQTHQVEIITPTTKDIPATTDTRLLVSWGSPLTLTTEGKIITLHQFDAIPLPQAAKLTQTPNLHAALLRVTEE